MAVRRDGAGGQHFGGKRCAGKSVTGEVLTEVEGTGQEYIASVSVAVEDSSTVGRMIGTGPEGNISDFCSGTVRAGMLAEVCLTEEEGTRSEFITSSRGEFFTSSTG